MTAQTVYTRRDWTEQIGALMGAFGVFGCAVFFGLYVPDPDAYDQGRALIALAVGIVALLSALGVIAWGAPKGRRLRSVFGALGYFIAVTAALALYVLWMHTDFGLL